MPVMRIVLLVVVVGGLALFVFSNFSPVLPLVFLGTKTPALPLGAWVGGAIAAGAITTFFLQLLNSWPRNYSTPVVEELGDIPPRTRSFRRETPEPDAPEPQTRYSPPPPETSRNSAASDWEESNDKDWNFDEEPVTPTSTQQEFDRDYPSSTPQAERTDYEARQEAKTGYQSGSVYSYSYREPKESGVGKTEEVYDANYRVITPPYQKPAEPEEEDDEDWGFEDDEDFYDEHKSQQRRR